VREEDDEFARKPFLMKARRADHRPVAIWQAAARAIGKRHPLVIVESTLRGSSGNG